MVSYGGVAVLGTLLGLGLFAATADSDQPERSTATADSNQPEAPTATADANQPEAKPIRITRVSYDPPGSDTGTNAHLNREWVAIKNFGMQARQLWGWTLRDTSGHVFDFPRFRLRPDTTVQVHTGHGQRTRHDLYWGSGAYIWNNTGDRATLRNSNGLLIDRCSWGDGDGLKNC